MSAHQRILAVSFGFYQPQSLNVSFRSAERQTPMNELSELADIALQEYKEGRTKAFTQDMYFNEETKQWCYFDEDN